MNTRGLEAFVAVAGTLNFTKAAEQLFITQPALSRLIAALEAELGIKLLSRTTRTVELTEAGKLLLPLAEGVLRGCEDLLRAAERAQRGMVGALNFGYNPLAGQPDAMVETLAEFSRNYPNVVVDVRREYSRQLVEGVLAGALDCALVSYAYLEGVKELDFLPLQRFGLYALLRRDDPRAALLPLSVHSLEGASLTIMKETAPRTYRTVTRTFAEHGVSFVEDRPVKDLEELIFRVRSLGSVGITSFCDPDHQYPDLIAAEMLEFPPKGKRGLAWRKDCANPFVECLRKIAVKWMPD